MAPWLHCARHVFVSPSLSLQDVLFVFATVAIWFVVEILDTRGVRYHLIVVALRNFQNGKERSGCSLVNLKIEIKPTRERESIPSGFCTAYIYSITILHKQFLQILSAAPRSNPDRADDFSGTVL